MVRKVVKWGFVVTPGIKLETSCDLLQYTLIKLTNLRRTVPPFYPPPLSTSVLCFTGI